MTSPEETDALTASQPDDLVEVVRTAEEGLRDVLEQSQATYEKGAQPMKERSGKAIVALHRQGHSWSEIARLTGLSRTTVLRRAQPYLSEGEQ